MIRRPCYLQIRNASIPPSPTRPRSSSTAWSDPDVSESQAAYATLRDTSSSLLSIGPDITRQTMTSRTTICRALLFHSTNCKPPRETGGCTHACPSRPSCNHTHTRAARQCRPTITTRSNMRITLQDVLLVCLLNRVIFLVFVLVCVHAFLLPVP